MPSKPDPAAGEPIRDQSIDSGPADNAAHLLSEALRGLRYGSVLAIVQDGVIVQIERTEKRRIRR